MAAKKVHNEHALAKGRAVAAAKAIGAGEKVLASIRSHAWRVEGGHLTTTDRAGRHLSLRAFLEAWKVCT